MALCTLLALIELPAKQHPRACRTNDIFINSNYFCSLYSAVQTVERLHPDWQWQASRCHFHLLRAAVGLGGITRCINPMSVVSQYKLVSG